MPRADLESRTALYRSVLLRLRHAFTRAELEALTGDRVLQVAVENRWFGDTPRPAVEDIATVTIRGERAWLTFRQQPGERAWLTFRQQPDRPLFFLTRERGEWKIALVELLQVADETLEQQIRQSGKVVDSALLLETLQKNTSDPVDPAILDGPRD